MNNLISFFIRRPLLGDFISVVVVIAGIFAAFSIRREMFPNISYDIIEVNLPYPGASAEEVEKILVTPLELDLKEVDGIKKIQSYSIESLGSIYLTLDPDQTTEKEAEDEIQNIVDRFELPSDAKSPQVRALKTKQVPIVELGVSGELSDVELRDYTKKIERSIEELPGVARVVETATRKKEVHVEINPKKLQQLRLSLEEVIRSLKTQNLSVPGGKLDPAAGETVETIIKTVGEFKTIDEIAETVVRSNDLAVPIKIKDIAKLSYNLEPEKSISRVNAKKSLNLWVLKKEKYDAINLVDNVKKELVELNKAYNGQVSITLFNDASVYIRNRLQVISSNFLMGIAMVLLLLTLMLPWKLALIVALGEPFALLGSLILFPYFDISINIISMIGIILVSGMLVDDSVLVCDNIYRKIEEGQDPVEAAIEGTKEVWPAVTASVFVILACFIPLMSMSGIFGKFVRQIPLGAILPLLVSLFEGIFILPSHVGHWVGRKIPKSPSPLKVAVPSKKDLIWSKILSFYEDTVRVLIRFKYLTMTSLVGLVIAVALLGVYGMNFVLFPKEGIDIFFIRAEAPIGTTLDETAKRFHAIENILKQLPKSELSDFSTLIGAQLQDPGDPTRRYGSHFGQITVFMTPESGRERKTPQLQEDLRKAIGSPEGLKELRFDSVAGGPPQGKAIDIGVRGESFEVIMKSVQNLKDELKKIAGVNDIQDTLLIGKEEVRIKLNPSEAAAANLSVAEVGMAVRAAFEGIIATSIQELDDEIDLRVVYREEDRNNLKSLVNLEIPNSRGNLVKLSKIATFEKNQAISTYIHEGRKRQVKVNGGLDLNVTNNRKMSPLIDELIKNEKTKFPQLEYVVGGESEDTDESLKTLFTAFAYSIAFIFLVLVILFKNLVQPMLILLVIPLGLISSVIALFLHGQPLSFMAIMGMIALSGVIANNAIVFVDFVNQLRERGKDLTESIIKTASLRIRPILLTSVTNVVGVLPIAYGIGGEDKFVGILALGLGWGLFVGSILIAFVIPVGISISDDIRSLFERKKSHA